MKQSKTEKQIYKLKLKLWKEYQKQKPRQIADYEVWIAPGKKEMLSKLFGKHSEMLLIHNMGLGCSYCTLWADGFNGYSAYFPKRAAFVLENDEAPQKLFPFAKKRGWKFPVVSSSGSALKKDLDVQSKKDGNWPAVSSLIKDKKGRLFQKNVTSFGPGDNFSPIWDLFALLPKGSANFEPNYDL